jgi:hypothetical protein
MDKKVFVKAHAVATQRAIAAWLDAPEGYVMTITPPKRSLQQSAMFHGMVNKVSKQAQWLGKPREPYQWKNLFISGHAIATGIGSEMVPGLEGEFLNIREKSSGMSIRRMNSLIDYTGAWCAMNDIETGAL